MRGFAPFRDLVLEVARTHQYPADLLAAQAAAESGFDPEATSPVGAVGLMQFMPDTWREWGSGDRTNPRESLDAGVRYMRWLLGCVDTWQPDPFPLALAAYNCGIGTLRRARRRAQQEGRQFPSSWPTLMALVPRETRMYVARILGSRERFAAALEPGGDR